MATPKSAPCANLVDLGDGKRGNCPVKAYLICNYCHLVQYCGADCQQQHWPQHKESCEKSPLGKDDWQPGWATERRQPTFVSSSGQVQLPRGRSKHLWGNVPAYDLMNLKANEGKQYQKDLKLCFAGSGDLRNLILTVLGLPDDYGQNCTCVLNDRDGDIVLRNLIMLIFAFCLPPEEAAKAMLHLWYSARLPASVLDLAQSRILPMVEDVCEKIKDKADSSLQSKTWMFGKTSLRMVLTKSEWENARQYFHRSLGLEEAERSRKGVVQAPKQEDFLDRKLFLLQPFARVGTMRYWTTGVLAPFSFDISAFDKPNWTLFNDAKEWQLKILADPLNGWRVTNVIETARAHRFPKNDLYGALACHVTTKLEAFCTKASTLSLAVELYHFNARNLPEYLEPHTFDRVEVTNLTDEAYLGLAAVLDRLGPLLKHKAENPHATLVSLFLNAAMEMRNSKELREEQIAASRILQVSQYLPTKAASSRYDPEFLRFTMAEDMFLDFDALFAKHMEKVGWGQVAAKTSMRMKEKHTIIAKWPYRLKQWPDTPATQLEFDLLYASNLRGHERYVEWQRA